MLDYFAMAYKDWLYHRDCWRVLTQIYILVLTLTLVQELWVLLPCRRPPLLKHTLQLLLAVQLSGKPHEDSDYTAVNAVAHWRLGAKLTLVVNLWVL